jgi:hypothetical protein
MRVPRWDSALHRFGSLVTRFYLLGYQQPVLGRGAPSARSAEGVGPRARRAWYRPTSVTRRRIRTDPGSATQ